jgi:phosphatidylserine/phosphatidylglycerophosphate/cardiolipin synthase-like enzyme
VYTSTQVSLPSQQNPLIFYSTQTSDDLRVLFKNAIEHTKHSLFLQIYGCTDLNLLNELQKAHKRQVNINLLYDPTGSGALNKKLPFAIPLSCQGLMHKKILISDEKTIFLGSANLTPTSLRMHDNIVIGIYHPEFASFLQSSLENHFCFLINNQPAEYWHLPDFHHQCLNKILDLIRTAKSSIHLALFTFTHPLILKELIKAHQRGVLIHIAIDFYSARGASKTAIQTLNKEGIIHWVGPSNKLLHHKWALIDEKTLLVGSANWTRLAFQKNEDCLFILHDMTHIQKKYFLRIWKEIQKNGTRS